MACDPPPGVRLAGYRPGLIGRITALHAEHYHLAWGFDLSFERQVATELSAFLGRYDPERDLLLCGLSGDGLAGSVAVDGRPGEEGARLRWFITAEAWRGRGLGGCLLERAAEFARAAGHPRLFLWTFAGLEPARRRYQAAGFRLTREHEVGQWGQTIREQRYDLVF